LRRSNLFSTQQGLAEAGETDNFMPSFFVLMTFWLEQTIKQDSLKELGF
jgi:hypothetical protein